MAVEFIFSDRIVTYDIQSSDAVFLQRDVNMRVIGDAFNDTVAPNGSRLQLDGNIYAGGDVLTVATSTTTFSMVIGEYASVYANEFGLFLNGLTDLQFSNAGFMHTGNAGIYMGPSLTSTATVFNSGTMIANGDGGGGILFLRSSAEVTNTGTMRAEIDDLYYATIFAFNASGTLALNNSGKILAGSKNAIYSTASSDITNTGLIEGRVALDANRDKIVNSGLIRGDVNLGGGGDIYDGRGGRVIGEIYGGAGNDTYIVDNARNDINESANDGNDWVLSEISYTLGANLEKLTLLGSEDIHGFGNGLANVMNGNNGDNRMRGFGGADRLNGGGGEDNLHGNDGNDRLNGGFGDDLLRGGDGGDILNGDKGDDDLRGELRNDTLNGAAGDDRLLGGYGADTLTGGSGDDTLNGGAGNDDFIFANGFGKDVITDFDARSGAEDISLAAVTSITNFADLSANHMTRAGKNVLIDAGNGNTILLKNVALADLDASDFLF